MTLSAPIYRLKREAKTMSREGKIPLHEALDRLAIREGFAAWALLAAKYAQSPASEKIYARLSPGDVVLIGARPGQGKTLLSLELAVQAMGARHLSRMFTLESTELECEAMLRAIGADPKSYESQFEFHGTDGINANYIINALASAEKGTLAVIDFLQLLDQRRTNPPLDDQVRDLKELARDRGLILVFLSQIDRLYNPSIKQTPDLSDVRLANPLNMSHFDKFCFLSEGNISFR